MAGVALGEGTGMKGIAAGMIAGLLVCGLTGERAGAQAVAPPASTYKTSITLKKIETQKIRTPEFRVNITPAPVRGTRDWFQLTAHFDTHAEWSDELNLVCYMLLRSKVATTGPRQTLLRGEVTLINIPKGKHKYEWYVHPGTLARYGEPEAVAVLINRQGQLVAMTSQPPDHKRWWEELTPLNGMALRRSETPFSLLCFDDFDQVKPAVEGTSR